MADLNDEIVRLTRERDEARAKLRERTEQRDALAATVEKLVSAVRENHEWHKNYDEYGGYPESDLCITNMEALCPVPTTILAARDRKVKEEALLEALSRCDYIPSNPAVALVRTEIRHMIDTIEKESGNG